MPTEYPRGEGRVLSIRIEGSMAELIEEMASEAVSKLG
jgi:hypothetical protein